MSVELAAARGTAASVERRNYRLGVLNGIFYQAGDGFVDAGTVIPVFLARLTSSNALIGFATAMSDFGWLLPQVFVAPWVARFPRQVPVYLRAATFRALGLALVAILAWPLSDHPGALLAAFFLGYGAYSLFSGVGAVAFMEVVGRTVPHDRLPGFWAERLFWGGIGAAIVSLLVRQALVLPDHGIAYALLFAGAAFLTGTGFWLFTGIEEPAHTPPAHPTSSRELLRQGVQLFRHDPPFRHLLLARAVLNVWFAASPFLVLFVVRDLGGGARSVGTFLLARTAGFIVSNLAWRPIAARHGTRALMQIGSSGTVALALIAAAVGIASPWKLGWIGTTAAIVLLEIVAFGGGIVQSALNVGYGSLMIELAPAGSRQSFVSLLNTFLGPTMLLPALGGAVVDAASAPVLFAACGVVALIGARSAWRLPRRRHVEPAPEIEALQPEQPS